MKSILLTALYLLLNTILSAQNIAFYIEPISSINKRIIIDSPTTRNLINSYEIPKVAVGLNAILESRESKFAFGFGYQRLRYGTKKYAWPDSLRNITPQSAFVKDFIVTNQLAAFIIHNFKYLKNGDSFFAKYTFIMNSKSNFHRQGYFDNGDRAIKTISANNDVPRHKWDGSIGFGFAHCQRIGKTVNTKISLFSNLFLTPYRTGESYYFYLPIRSGTKGILWNTGVSWAFKIY